MAETHVSVVVFLGDRVYKVKKPVRLGFLDFSTVAARRAACHREVALNRRLAPDVYLGVADVHGPDGEVCDHLVVMRRLPADRRLATLVTEGRPVDEHVRALARLVGAFHARAATSPAVEAAATAVAVARLWESSLDEVRPLVGPLLDPAEHARVEHLARAYVTGRAPLFQRRIAEGRARDGHGDLLADDVFCLDDGPRVLDCLEFDDRLRYGDVLADVAFLAMDLERLGARDLGERFLGWYREQTGDAWPPSLAHHYVAYRAYVRCKVAVLRWAQGDTDAAGAARGLLALARRRLEAGRVRLVLVGGAPGTGKSTLARALGERLGWTVLRSDQVRKELAGLRPDQPVPAPLGTGLYRPEAVAATYRALLARAAGALRQGGPVIVDASFSDPLWRAEAAAVARETASDLVALRCQAPVEEAMARVRARRPGTDPSDATAGVAAALAARAAPWPEAVAVDTAGRLDDAVAAALAAVAPERG